MTVPEFLKLCAAGDARCDAMVMPFVGWTWGYAPMWTPGTTLAFESWYRRGWSDARAEPLPYATAGAEHPDRWRLWGEMLETLAELIHGGDRPRALLAAAHSVQRWRCARNAALAAALLLAAGILEDE